MAEHLSVNGASYALVNCYSCGVFYLIPDIIEKAALERRGPNGRTVYCPNGHEWYYVGQTEAEKLRQERDRLQQRLAQKDDEIAEKAREVSAAKGQITKLKKRASAGTCPCCNRTFQNMATHMRKQHPDFSKPDLKVVAS